MMKKYVAYEFKDAKSKTDFYNRMLANQDIVAAIEANGDKFYVGVKNDVGNCFLYTTDSYLTYLKDSDDTECVIREDEFQYFKEAETASKSAIDKFDKAVASYRAWRSESPLSEEVEKALDMIRFGISIQD